MKLLILFTRITLQVLCLEREIINKNIINYGNDGCTYGVHKYYTFKIYKTFANGIVLRVKYYHAYEK